VSKMDNSKLQAILNEYATLPEYSGYKIIDVNTMSLFGDYPINIAATRGIMEEVKSLLDSGANINSKGEHGYTPLHNAVEQGHVEIVKLLLAFDADKKIQNNDGDAPLALSELLGEEKISKLLRP
jgi:ankyrin repeat protein